MDRGPVTYYRVCVDVICSYSENKKLFVQLEAYVF